MQDNVPRPLRARRQTLLVPVAYSETVMPSLRLARSSRTARRVGKVLFWGLTLSMGLMAFTPWQQSIKGSGSVQAFSPDQRPQVIQAPIKGRLVELGEEIFDNAQVTKGQVIAVIQDLDESYSQRLEQQLLNTRQSVTGAQDQLRHYENALDFAETIVEYAGNQVRAYESVKRETIAAQDAFIEMARKKVQAESQQLAEYEAAIPQIEAEHDRLKTLNSEGIIALQKFQEVERKLNEARAKVSRGQAYVAAAEAELEAKIRERVAKIEKAQVDIDYAESALRKAGGDVAKAEADIAKVKQELAKAEKEVLEMQVKVARQESQVVTAPFDGYVVEVTPNLGTAILKEGDTICTIVPKTTDRSVQLWVGGNDAPLVEPGRHVRLQFEGWPAVQFSGWPSVAVGTFGGDVVSIDATDNGKGKFRVLIRPHDEEHQWPDERFLRQGVRANGWILLNQVPLWYEVWRQLNAFPPVISLEEPGAEKSEKSKPPKLPK